MERIEVEDLGPSVAGMSAIYQSLSPVFGENPRTGVVDEQHRRTARKILLHSGVWLPPHVYQSWPVLFPWMVRDNAEVKAGRRGWAHPGSGLEIQDNKPLGSIKDKRPVQWGFPGSPFGAKPLATGPHQWMQSHCWDEMTTEPTTNSFVPNLVWLPYGLGRLTDDPGSLFSQEVRRIAWSLYRNLPVPVRLQPTVDRIWRMLDSTVSEPVAAVELEGVNWFVVDEGFHVSMQQRHLDHHRGVVRALEGRGLTGLKVAKKYRDTLPHVPTEVLSALRDHLEPFASSAEQFTMPVEATLATSAPKSGAGAKKSPVGSPGGSSDHAYLVTSPSGQLHEGSRSRAAVALVRAVLTAGVDAATVQKVLPGSMLRGVQERLDGDALWESLEAGGAKGGRKKWFVDDPIYVGRTTWVVNSHAWTEAAEAAKFPKLCALTGGAVSYAKAG